MKRSRPRGYLAAYNPQAKTRALLDDVIDVLNSYRDYLPLTDRQIFYALVGQKGYPKEEKFYTRLCEHVGNARRGRMIRFQAIRDSGVSVASPNHFTDEDGFWLSVWESARTYKRNKLARQPYHVEVWCEAAGMVPQLARVASAYSIEVWSCSGFDSLTAKKELADRICRKSKPAMILHFGDLDVWGQDIYGALADDVRAFVLADRPHGLVDVSFQRVALNDYQVEYYSLPTAPPKAAARGRGPERTCQLEALPPDLLADELREAIEEVLDLAVYDRDIEAESAERQRIAYALPSPNGGPR